MLKISKTFFLRYLYSRFYDAALASAAETCIIPLQDYMDFDDFARMNNPADKDGAWRFRFWNVKFLIG